MAAIIALGSINVDVQVRADRAPEPGETLLASEFRLLGGGKAANVASFARGVGVPASVIGRVGDDVLRSIALSPLDAAGVDLSGTQSVKDCATGVALVVVARDGEKGIVLAANANDRWRNDGEADIAEAVKRAGRRSVLVVDLEVPASIVGTAIRAARASDDVVLLDPSPADRVCTDLLRLVDGVTPNPAEARTLTGIAVRSEQDAITAGHALVSRGTRVAFMKLPEGGCCVVDAQRAFRVRAPRVDVVDKTGAGDAFCAALAVALLEARPLEEAARLAVAAATIAVGAFGAQPSYPTRAALEAMMARVSQA